MRRTLPDVLWLAAAAALAWLVAEGPPEASRERQVALLSEPLPATTVAPDAPYERLAMVRAADVEASRQPLVPDPRARRVRLVRAEGDRVLDPDHLLLAPLATPRAGRPLALELQAVGAVDADSIEWRLGDGPLAPLTAAPGGALAGARRAVLELPELSPAPVTIEVRWKGERGGRAGAVLARFELQPLPPPAFWLGPGVDPGAPMASALRLQGWRAAESLETSDLAVLSACRPVPPGLGARVDRGLGVLFVVEADRGLAPSVLELAPVVAGVAAPAPPAAESAPAAGDNEPARTDAPAAPEPEKPAEAPAPRDAPASRKPEADALRRPGEVGARESEEARASAKRRRTKAIALVLVVDRSGSMAMPEKAPRFEMAKRGAVATAQALGPGDEFALVTFGARAEVVVPLGPADRIGALREALGRTEPTAHETRCLPGIKTAWELLKQTSDPFPIRHVVILTDGEFHDQGQDYDTVLAAMKREGIGVSGLGISDSSDALSVTAFTFLKERLRAIGGGLKTSSSSTDIPRLLLGEVEEVLAAATPMPHEGKAPGEGEAPKPKAPPPASEPPKPRPQPTAATPPVAARPGAARSFALHAVDLEPLLAGFTDTRWPSVSGHATLEARVRARVHLAAGTEGHSFLATAPHGLGRLAVWAGTDGPPWCGELAAAEWFPRLVGQVAAWLAQPVPAADVAATTWGVLTREILEGDGVPDAMLADLARRLGATIDSGPPIGSVRDVVPGRPSPWLAAMALALCLLLALERRLGA